jgi:hypothetical protein
MTNDNHQTQNNYSCIDTPMLSLACPYCQSLHHVHVMYGEFGQHKRFATINMTRWELGATHTSMLLPYRIEQVDKGKRKQ